MTMPTLIVELFNAGAATSTYLQLGDSARGKLDTGMLGSDTQVWTDITAYVQRCTIRRGSTRVEGPWVTYQAGTATIQLLNNDRRFDPTNTSGPYTTAGVTQLRPMVAIRIRATWNGTTYDLWRGYVDSWPIDYDGPNFSTVTVTGTDGQKVLNQNSRTAVAAVGGSELTGARINRILDSAGWSSTDRVIATGDSTLQATTLEGPAWTEAVQAAVASELGELYFDGAGRVVFRNRKAIMQDSRSATVQATFGDSGAELAYANNGLTLMDDDSLLVNQAHFQRTGGALQTVDDVASQEQFLIRTADNTSMQVEADSEALSAAQFLVYQGKDCELRFDEMTVLPLADGANLFPQVLGRELGDRLNVNRRPPGGGSVISRDVFIRGIDHEIEPDNWRTTWSFGSATRYSFMTLDNATLGTLDSNALAY